MGSVRRARMRRCDEGVGWGNGTGGCGQSGGPGQKCGLQQGEGRDRPGPQRWAGQHSGPKSIPVNPATVADVGGRGQKGVEVTAGGTWG